MSAVAAAWTRFDAGDLSAWDPAKRYEAFWYDLWLDEPRVRSAVEATLAPLAAPLLPDRLRALTDRLYVAGEGRPGFNHFHRDFSSNTGAMVQLWMPLEDRVGEAGGSLELLPQSAAAALDAAVGGPCAGRLGAQARDLPRGSSCEREAAAAGVLAEMRLGDVLVKLPGVWHRAAALGQMRRRVAYTVSFVPEREAEDR